MSRPHGKEKQREMDRKGEEPLKVSNRDPQIFYIQKYFLELTTDF